MTEHRSRSPVGARLRRHSRLVILALVLGFAGCDKAGPSQPSVLPADRALGLVGELHFGDVPVDTQAERIWRINNTGRDPVTVTGLTGPASGFSASWTAGTIPTGSGVDVIIRFRPTEARYYAGVLRLQSDATRGQTDANISGTGVRTGPLWTQSGTGDTVFDMPTAVTRVKITGDYTRNSSNFIVYVARKLVVNELLGTAWQMTHFEGTYLVTGGVVEIQSSSGVAWTFTEVR